jgi:ABC-2 type transport system permease protein
MHQWPLVSMVAAARRTVRDRAGLFVSLGFYLIVASVLATLWRAAAHAHHGTISGYSAAQLTWYIMFSEAAVVALNPRLIELIGDDIAGGAITVELLRPASVLWVRVTTELGRCLPRVAACAVLAIGVSWLVVGAPPHTDALALALPALVLAVACNIVAQHAFAAASFWLRDARSTWFLYHKLVFVLGGMLIPVQFLPGVLHTIAVWLPFVAMAYAPARLASGHFEPQLLALQVAWLVALSALASAVFGAGERRLQVVGG